MTDVVLDLNGVLPPVSRLRNRPPWWGGDLQTLANKLVFRENPKFAHAQHMEFPVRDGSGDKMTGTLHDPGKGGPLVILLHGVAGSEDSTYVLQTADYFAERGRRVLRLNLRGAGSSIQSCSQTYHSNGTDELSDVLDALPNTLLNEGAVLVGFSIGGSILLNFLARLGDDAPVLSALTVSAPLDLLAAAKQIGKPRNWVYQRALVGSMLRTERRIQEIGLIKQPKVLPAFQTLYQYDDLVTAKRHSFENAEDYYIKSSPFQRLSAIKRPLVMLHARNDPWIPSSVYEELLVNENKHPTILLSPSGGHVGFHFRGLDHPLYISLIEKILLSVTT